LQVAFVQVLKSLHLLQVPPTTVTSEQSLQRPLVPR